MVKSPLLDIHREWVKTGKLSDPEKHAAAVKKFLRDMTECGVCNNLARKNEVTKCDCLKDKATFEKEMDSVVADLIRFGCQKKEEQQKELIIQIRYSKLIRGRGWQRTMIQ